ncbi:MAG: hypothetical protein L3J78_03890 [Thermoplasmata archaeon]|nr:hypothetical protein [Thermoplasmata archaeon]
MEREKVGEVFHFFGHISVAAIRLTDGGIAIGDTVQIQGPTTNLEQTVDTLQIEHGEVSHADRGQEVGMKVRDRVREKDYVYKLVPEASPRAVPLRPKAVARPKAAAKRKPAAKRRARPKPKASRKPKTRVKKASRARRSKARRGSRKSRAR